MLCDKKKRTVPVRQHWRSPDHITFTGGNMAAPNLTSGQRLDVYRTLSLLNRSFYLIVQRLEKLDAMRIFNPQHLKELRGLTQELQADVNNHLLEKLHFIERDDCYRFSQIRIAREKRLQTPVKKPRK
jgi:hypothetical protein